MPDGVRLLDMVGTTYPTYRFLVEAGKIAEFASAVRADRRSYGSHRDSGSTRTPAPPTFTAASLHWRPPESAPHLGLDVGRMVAGGCEWEYVEPLFAGDVVDVSTVIESVTEKQGRRGPMTLINFRSEFVREETLAVVYTVTTIYFGSATEMVPSHG